ncbi:uncharacterized protein LOC111250193 isoform X1 [Varroa destructor]|uniref:Uncharacterized protein n=1 Tax=Varroa destructor TaxID=109461 RepID=A0A7M7K2Q4_VARDE|nr:uncharacterized protein LOC111250193 isoform X1 [Varroa destructor]
MRFRGLPLELNCGPVDLELTSRTAVAGPLLPLCGPCGFVSVSYYVLLGCGHVQCDSCALVFPEKHAQDTEERNIACCSVCNETSEATPMKISITALEKLNFYCPCGMEGTLKELRQHRKECRVTEKMYSSPTTESLTGIADSTSSGEASSSRMMDADSIAANVKETLLIELQRVEEDIVNRLEMRRASVEDQVRDCIRKIGILEAELTRLRAENQQRNTNPTTLVDMIVLDTQRNSLAIRNIEQQMTRLPFVANSREDIIRWVVRHSAQSVLLWFNVKKLLQQMNRNGSPATSDDQEALLGGYPCRVHLAVGFVEGRKMLGVYIGTSNERSSADWPMKRRLTMKIYDNDGTPFIEDDIGTTDPEAGNYFKGPNSQGMYGINDFISIEILTNQNFYRRNQGMVCIGIESSSL